MGSVRPVRPATAAAVATTSAPPADVTLKQTKKRLGLGRWRALARGERPLSPRLEKEGEPGGSPLAALTQTGVAAPAVAVTAGPNPTFASFPATLHHCPTPAVDRTLCPWRWDLMTDRPTPRGGARCRASSPRPASVHESAKTVVLNCVRPQAGMRDGVGSSTGSTGYALLCGVGCHHHQPGIHF